MVLSRHQHPALTHTHNNLRGRKHRGQLSNVDARENNEQEADAKSRPLLRALRRMRGHRKCQTINNNKHQGSTKKDGGRQPKANKTTVWQFFFFWWMSEKTKTKGRSIIERGETVRKLLGFNFLHKSDYYFSFDFFRSFHHFFTFLNN